MAVSVTATSASATDTAGSGPGVQTLFFQIKAKHSGKCLAVNPLNGAVVQSTCVTPTPGTQLWRIDNVGTSKYYTLTPGHNPAVCLAAANAGTTNGTPVRVDGCLGFNTQWDIRFGSSPFYELRPRHATTMCLDVKTDAPVEGAPLQLWTCLGPLQDNQQFQFLSA